MHAQTYEVVDRPVSPVSGRFPLGLPMFGLPVSAEPPSPVGVRPFGLRFATPVTGRAVSPSPWRFCPQRQIALTDDGSGQPWYRLDAAGTGSKATTGATPDGQGGTGNEEWTPDYMGDASA